MRVRVSSMDVIYLTFTIINPVVINGRNIDLLIINAQCSRGNYI